MGPGHTKKEFHLITLEALNAAEEGATVSFETLYERATAAAAIVVVVLLCSRIRCARLHAYERVHACALHNPAMPLQSEDPAVAYRQLYSLAQPTVQTASVLLLIA
eukprot:20045-Heterococcus_DN1.PRE.2